MAESSEDVFETIVHSSQHGSQSESQSLGNQPENKTNTAEPLIAHSLQLPECFDKFPDLLQRPLSGLSINKISARRPSQRLESLAEDVPDSTEPTSSGQQPINPDNLIKKSNILFSSSCIECVKAIPVRNRKDVKVGDHIINSGILYDHHAIVIDILPDEKDEDNQKKARIKLIHSTNSICGAFAGLFKLFGGKAKILQTSECFDFERCKIMVVKYIRSPFGPSEVVRRAKKKHQDKDFKYHVFRNNCEHFATYCVTGERFSVQINKLILAMRMLLPLWFKGLLDEKFRNKLAYERGMICKPCFKRNEWLFAAKKKPINALSEVKKGDLITFPYWYFDHNAIVMETHAEGPQNRHKKVGLTIAHYAFCGPFQHHTIILERRSFNLDGSVTVTMYESPEYNVFSPDETVERAKKRINEQQYTYFANNSSHFARWCKLKRTKSISLSQYRLGDSQSETEIN
ncbi:hypothetical protein FSP39_025356 [Pinctada imbricata]|uniref:LRAT domain-containing protein n=1 Tax=Pinctada imbricata TaxID=66713 RepID=A0AA88XC40_PINIB|nr:hypothetical protein FSP39_025356 [Pinctada imbricata]